MGIFDDLIKENIIVELPEPPEPLLDWHDGDAYNRWNGFENGNLKYCILKGNGAPAYTIMIYAPSKHRLLPSGIKPLDTLDSAKEMAETHLIENKKA